MTTNIALKSRTRCYSFDQSVRKCNDGFVVNMITKIASCFRTEWYLLCYCCCVKHPAHRNIKNRVYPLRCQDSGPPTRSYTAAAGVSVRCCCCCGLGTRTHTRTVPLTSGWKVYIPRRGTHQQAAQEACMCKIDKTKRKSSVLSSQLVSEITANPSRIAPAKLLL